jgi:indolepyruvate ferredoxin oxidoreductase
VVTIGALLGMAGHIENKGVTVLDITGLAQKGGAVMSHVQIARHPGDIHATRIAMGEASLVIGCDALVTAGDEALSRTNERTRVAVNGAPTPTADFIKNPHWRFPGTSAEHDIRAAVGHECDIIDANQLAVALLGDAIFTNPFMLGYAWQKGWLPLTRAALVRAIELNNVQVEKNKAAFEWGRRAAHDLAAVQALGAAKPGPAAPDGATKVISLHTPNALEALIGKREKALSAYQNAAYAQRYRQIVASVQARETTLAATATGAMLPLTEAVTKNLHKLMAYKDEYEVARLYADPAFIEKIRGTFEGEWRLHFYLAPPMLAKRDAHGHLVKQKFGPWLLPAFRVLAKLKFLRGTAFDLFGKSEERRTERELIEQYVALVGELTAGLTAENLPLALELANLPDLIRGFGHVKENNLTATRVKWQALLARWRAPHDRSKQVA